MSGKNLTISIQIDKKKKKLYLSAPVYSGKAALVRAVATYLDSIPLNHRFSLSIHEEEAVWLCETLPCSFGPQPTLRQQFYDFQRRAQQCRHHFRCIANQEKFGDAQSLLES